MKVVDETVVLYSLEIAIFLGIHQTRTFAQWLTLLYNIHTPSREKVADSRLEPLDLV